MHIDWILGLLLGQMFHVQRLKLYRITSQVTTYTACPGMIYKRDWDHAPNQITISHPSTSLCRSEASRPIMRIYLASVFCSLAITSFFLAVAIPIQSQGPPAPVNPQVDELPKWVKATVIIPEAFMPHEDDNSPSMVEMYIPHDDNIPAVVSVVNILRLMRLSVTGNRSLREIFKNFEASLRKVLISVSMQQEPSRGIRKENENDAWKVGLYQHVTNHNKKIWYNPGGSEGVEQEVKDGLKSMNQPINVIDIGINWGQDSMIIPKNLLPPNIKDRFTIRIPVDADIPGVASLLNIVDFIRKKRPDHCSTSTLNSFVYRMNKKLRFLPKSQDVIREPMANKDFKDSVVEIVKSHNKRIWFRPGGWENLEGRVREALKSGVPERKPKRIRSGLPLSSQADSPNSSKAAKFPMQPTSPMHQHPGLNVDPEDQMHPHDSTLHPDANLHTGSNPFDFNAPFIHSSPNPMVAKAINQGFQVPSFSDGHILRPHDNFNAPLSHSSPNPMVATAINQGFQVPSFSDGHILHPHDNFNAPLSHSSPNPMVATAINQGFQVPSFSDGHILHPHDNFNAPLSHSSPNPMVATAINQGFQVPSFSDGHILRPHDNFNAPLSHSSPNPMVATAINQGFQVLSPSSSDSHLLNLHDNPQLMDLSHYPPYNDYNHPSGSEGYSQEQSSVEVSSLGLPPGSHSSLSPSSQVVAESLPDVMRYPFPPPRWI
ncbi:hypothetical protein H0H93_006916 [Arthromyces matolae]|nr:hypothetical protein H0H93_006916 [Arthromyces matolae]